MNQFSTNSKQIVNPMIVNAMFDSFVMINCIINVLIKNNLHSQ